MEPVVRKRGGGAWEGMYRLVMRRTPVYVTFVLVGAFVGERAVDRGIHALWEHINVGKRYEDISVLGRDSPKSEVTTTNNLPLASSSSA